MKYTRLLFYALISASLLFACQGEDGEPGPQGEPGLQGEKGDKGDAGENGQDGEDGVGFEKKGFFQGTVSGTRRDGTAFNETFSFEYGPVFEGISESSRGGLPIFEVYRTADFNDEFNYFYSEFRVTNKNLANESLIVAQNEYNENMTLNLAKEISPTTLFVLRARPKFISDTYLLAVNSSLNQTYKFIFNENGRQFNEEYNEETDENLYKFKTSDGKTVYYSSFSNYDATLDYSYGNVVRVINANGTTASNVPYNQLRFTRRNGSSDFVFRNTSGVDLSEEIEVPADTYEITNYLRNAQTGVVTFNVTYTIGTIGRYNTTTNPLTITAQFNSGGPVYGDIVSRKK
jgi:hypothetical protein